jgi:CubicO group peptidase (beta-lactamase class C family)
MQDPVQPPTMLLVGNRHNWLSPEYVEGSFQNVDQIFPTRRVPRGQTFSPLPHSDRTHHVKYVGRDTGGSLSEFIERNHIKALLVLRDGELVAEEYAGGATAQTKFLWFSVTKSIVSTLIGLALEDDHLASLRYRAERYCNGLIGTEYGKVSIRDLLTMRSGISFSEDYEAAGSDIAKVVGLVSRSEGGIMEFAASLGAAGPAGKAFNYSSMDTEVLGEVLTRCTGQNLCEFLSNRLWRKMGAEADAYWVLDQPGAIGRELASFGLSATARDIARFGRVMLGAAGDVVPRGWLRKALKPSRARFSLRKRLPNSNFGYGQQWWLLQRPRSLSAAIGVFGQFLIMDHASNTIMVCASAWPRAHIPELFDDVFAYFLGLSISRE